MTEESLFVAAMKRADRVERAEFLEAACGSDLELRRRVEALIAASEGTGEFLGMSSDSAVERLLPLTEGSAGGLAGVETTAPELAGSRDFEEPTIGINGATIGTGDEPTGTEIGPYTLRKKIGEGGMGVVYLADQLRPVRRSVALKVIKAGMDTRQVVARFDAERQALALMDHPGIARVLDAGATETGRPYFVMELVDGSPITEYCDTRGLTLSQRLELLISVCQAVQHAHQKGVIHRDIKPSNVLVAEVDGKPVPKVIDFGIAKAIDRPLIEQTFLTQQGAIVGTPEYMSPEQAGGAPDVDTRTDVYALGVLLYELLTGSTPLGRDRLRRVAMIEVLRRVREEEPPRPSTRLSDSGDRLASISAVRKTEPSKLVRSLRGDLDWVTMKAIEKDRTRRYGTAADLAADLRNYLEGDPVDAGPPSRSYRFGKFARKHRAAFVTTSVFALLLVVATAVSAYLAVRATAAEGLAGRRLNDLTQANSATLAALVETREAKGAAESALAQTREAKAATDIALVESKQTLTLMVDLLGKANPAKSGRDVRVVEVLEPALEQISKRFEGPGAVKGSLLHAIGVTFFDLGLYPQAISALNLSAEARRAALGADHRDTLISLGDSAEAVRSDGRPAEAIPALEQISARLTATFGADDRDAVTVRANLASAYRDVNLLDKAIPLFEDTVRRMVKDLGAEDRTTLVAREGLGDAYRLANRPADAEAIHREVLRGREATLGPDHFETLRSRANIVAVISGDFTRAREAIALMEPTLKGLDIVLGPNHPHTGRPL